MSDETQEKFRRRPALELAVIVVACLSWIPLAFLVYWIVRWLGYYG